MGADAAFFFLALAFAALVAVTSMAGRSVDCANADVLMDERATTHAMVRVAMECEDMALPGKYWRFGTLWERDAQTRDQPNAGGARGVTVLLKEGRARLATSGGA